MTRRKNTLGWLSSAQRQKKTKKNYFFCSVISQPRVLSRISLGAFAPGFSTRSAGGSRLRPQARDRDVVVFSGDDRADVSRKVRKTKLKREHLRILG